MRFKNRMLVVMLLATATSFTQNFKLYYNAGIASGLQVDSKDFSLSKTYGGQLGFSYSYDLKPNLGVSLGLGYSILRGQLNSSKSMFTSYEYDKVGESFELQTEAANYTETVGMHNIVIPLKLYYDTAKTAKSVGFYGGLGVKVYIPTEQFATVNADALETKGYYMSNNSTFTDLKNHGFGKWGKFGGQGKSLNSKISVVTTGEIGASFAMFGDRLYLGAFMDYGLSNMKKEEEGVSVVKYNPTGKPKAVSSLLGLKEVEKLSILSYGLQIKIGFM